MTFPFDVTVASSVRTAVGRANKGTLRHTRPDDLAATAMQGALDRVEGLDPAKIEDVIRVVKKLFPKKCQDFCSWRQKDR